MAFSKFKLLCVDDDPLCIEQLRQALAPIQGLSLIHI